MQVDMLLNEAELEAEILSVKKCLTSRQLATISVNTDAVPGICSVTDDVSLSCDNLYGLWYN